MNWSAQREAVVAVKLSYAAAALDLDAPSRQLDAPAPASPAPAALEEKSVHDHADSTHPPSATSTTTRCTLSHRPSPPLVSILRSLAMLMFSSSSYLLKLPRGSAPSNSRGDPAPSEIDSRACSPLRTPSPRSLMDLQGRPWGCDRQSRTRHRDWRTLSASISGSLRKRAESGPSCGQTSPQPDPAVFTGGVNAS